MDAIFAQPVHSDDTELPTLGVGGGVSTVSGQGMRLTLENTLPGLRAFLPRWYCYCL